MFLSQDFSPQMQTIAEKWLRLVILPLRAIHQPSIVHRHQCFRVAVAECAGSRLQALQMQRLGQVEALLVGVQQGEVVHGRERVRVVVAELAAAGVEAADVQRLGERVLPLHVVEGRQVVHGLRRHKCE